jgi:hypothetical protein
MPATLEQPTTAKVNTTLVPSITYDLLSVPNKSIHVTVIVSLSSDDPNHPLHFDAPIFGVPGSGLTGVSSTWDVIWTVAPGSGLDSVFFTDGILFPADHPEVPDAVDLPIHTEAIPCHADQFKATITHHVEEVNSFNYRMFVQGNSGGTLTPDSHDPTIAVVSDPIGG